MFSNGKFKNIVALVNSKEECPLLPWTSLNQTYSLHPAKGTTKNWIALEDSFNKTANILASTVPCSSSSPEDRNVFAIYVSYYVKVKLLVNTMGGKLSLKLPFTLTHGSKETDPIVVEAREAAAEQKQNPKQSDSNPITKDVKVECHEPKLLKNKVNASSVLSPKIKTTRKTIQDENEIIKCEEEEPI